MNDKVLILRPEPGATRSAARAEALGLTPTIAPLFKVRPLAWEPPEGDFEAVMLTSANGARHGGDGLASYRHLPCYGVGGATAESAKEAGFADVRIGPADSEALLRMMASDGIESALHLCGLDHSLKQQSAIRVTSLPVYAADPVRELPPEAQAALGEGALVLLHSPRAAALFGLLVNEERETIEAVAISPSTAASAGTGWASMSVAAEPRDEALLELAAKLCQTAREGTRRTGG